MPRRPAIGISSWISSIDLYNTNEIRTNEIGDAMSKALQASCMTGNETTMISHPHVNLPETTCVRVQIPLCFRFASGEKQSTAKIPTLGCDLILYPQRRDGLQWMPSQKSRRSRREKGYSGGHSNFFSWRPQ